MKAKQFCIKDLEKKYGRLTLGRFLVSWRLCEEITQRAFAKTLGISPANLCDIERGRKGVSLTKATEFAKRIGVSPVLLIHLAIQDEIESSGLNYTVEVKLRA